MKGFTHQSISVCIDGWSGVSIGEDSLFNSSGNVTLVSAGGSVTVGASSFFKAANLSMDAFGTLYLHKGIRTEISGRAELESDFVDAGIISAGVTDSVRIDEGAILSAGSLSIKAKGSIYLGKRGKFNASKNNLNFSVLGVDVGNSIKVAPRVKLSAQRNININGGNLFQAGANLAMTAERRLTVEAKGCRLGNKANFQGKTKAGKCLARGSKFNRSPHCFIDIIVSIGRDSFYGYVQCLWLSRY